jgi:hypothetical protein
MLLFSDFLSRAPSLSLFRSANPSNPLHALVSDNKAEIKALFSLLLPLVPSFLGGGEGLHTHASRMRVVGNVSRAIMHSSFKLVPGGIIFSWLLCLGWLLLGCFVCYRYLYILVQ